MKPGHFIENNEMPFSRPGMDIKLKIIFVIFNSTLRPQKLSKVADLLFFANIQGQIIQRIPPTRNFFFKNF